RRDGVDRPGAVVGGAGAPQAVDRGRDVVDGQPECPGDVVAGADGDDPERDARPGDDVRAEVDHPVPADDDDGVEPVGEGRPGPGQRVGEVAAGEVDGVVARGGEPGDDGGTGAGRP